MIIMDIENNSSEKESQQCYNVKNKNQQRNSIESLVKIFLKKGGVIKKARPDEYLGIDIPNFFNDSNGSPSNERRLNEIRKVRKANKELVLNIFKNNKSVFFTADEINKKTGLCSSTIYQIMREGIEQGIVRKQRKKNSKKQEYKYIG